VALVRLITTRRVWQGFARDRGSPKAKVTRSDDTEVFAGIDRHSMPVNPAVVLKDVEYRVPGGEILPSHIGRIDLQRPALSQHEQTSRVIDLSIHQDHCAYCRVAYGSPRLQFRKCAQLRKYIGGGMEQNPVGVIAGDCYRRLGACLCADCSFPQSSTVETVTIPLG